MRDCYVYRIFERLCTLYVGKGSGPRAQVQARRFGANVEIIEDGLTDNQAFEREKHWIAELKPTENKDAGGTGGRVNPEPSMPKSLKGQLTQKEWRAALRDTEKTNADIERIGIRRYCARFLLTKLDKFNCEQWGVTLSQLGRLQEVANGPKC